MSTARQEQVPQTVWWEAEAVCLIDQTLLPHEQVVVRCGSVTEVSRAIRTMQVRGAPALGVTAAYGMALAARLSPAATSAGLLDDLRAAKALLDSTRPTAVNLAWATARVLRRAEQEASAALPHDVSQAAASEMQGQVEQTADLRRRAEQVAAQDLPRRAEQAAATEMQGQVEPEGRADLQHLCQAVLEEAQSIRDEDEAMCRAIGRHGAALMRGKRQVLTHCNAGGLATAAYGTALAPLRTLHEAGEQLHVLVDETRPFMQGSRLTAWELKQAGIPLTLITDSMAGYFMRQGQVDCVIVGADRIVANGDVANKIGTYSLAVLARAHGIPFYVAAPSSTIDMSMVSGEQIPIEQRASAEVTHMGGRQIAPDDIVAAHPAFDVTPAELISAIITERGVVQPPYAEALRAILS